MSNFPINPIDPISLNGYLQNLSVPAIRDLLTEQARSGNFSENSPNPSTSSPNGEMAPEIPERDENLSKIAAPEEQEADSGPFIQTFGTSAKNRTAYVNPYMDRYTPETLSSPQTQESFLAAQETPSDTEDLTTSKKTPGTKNFLEFLSPETSASESELSLSGKIDPEQTIATLSEFSQRTNGKNISNPRAMLFNPLTGKRISSQTFPVPYNTLTSPLHSSLSPLLDIRSTIIQETTRGELFPILEFDVKHTQQLLSRLIATVAGFSQSGGQVDWIIDSQALDDTEVQLRFIIQAQQLNLPQSITAYLNGNEPLPSGPPLENLALNLGLCFQLAAFMKGTLAIRSNSREGTLFYLELPARKGSSRQGQYPSAIGRFSGRRILLAMQNSSLRDTTEALLHKRDIFIGSAADCNSAVRLFQKEKAGYYDAVLSSLGDPLTQQIRVLNRPDAPRVPIIAILPSPSGERLSNAFQSGCSTCLIQPFTAQELFDTLDLLLL